MHKTVMYEGLMVVTAWTKLGFASATESYATSALYTTLASLSGVVRRIRRVRRLVPRRFSLLRLLHGYDSGHEQQLGRTILPIGAHLKRRPARRSSIKGLSVTKVRLGKSEPDLFSRQALDYCRLFAAGTRLLSTHTPVAILIVQNLLVIGRTTGLLRALVCPAAPACRSIVARVALLGQREAGSPKRDCNRQGESLR
jgi:hypothetical protein